MKLKIREAVAVEGRYDAHAVRAAVDTLVIELGGFSILHSAEKIRFLQTVAAERGLILLTDSDAAGFLIRGRLRGQLHSGEVKMAYVPTVQGKERRKRRPGAEGLLGVEGMCAAVLQAALLDAGATPLDGGAEERTAAAAREGRTDDAARAADADETPGKAGSDKPPALPPVTRSELYERGFFGRAGSARKRSALLSALALPPHMSVNALVELLALPAYHHKYQAFIEQTEVDPK